MISSLDPATIGFSATLEELIDSAAGAGFQAVEFPIWAAERLEQEGRLDAVLAQAAERGVRAAQFTCGSGTPANIAIPAADFEAALPAWAQSCRFASGRGFSRASVLVNGKKGGSGSESGAALGPAELVDRLRKLADIAAPGGVRVSAEISDAALWPQAGEVIAACGRDNLGLLVDTYYLHRARGPQELLRGLPRHAVGWVHLADARGGADGPRRVLPGDGELPLDEALEAVRALGYEGEVSIEVYGEALFPGDTPAERARRAGASIARPPLRRWFRPG